MRSLPVLLIILLTVSALAQTPAQTRPAASKPKVKAPVKPPPPPPALANLPSAPTGECPESPGCTEYYDSMYALVHIDNYLPSDLRSSTGGAMNEEIIPWALKLREIFKTSRSCFNFFVEPNGRLGPYSVSAVKYISQNIVYHAGRKETSPFLQHYEDLSKECPGFDKMVPDQKMAVWAWMFEILGFNESSCNPNVPDNTAKNVPAGAAVGLLQMEPTREKRCEARGQHSPCCVDDSVIRTVDGNMACAVSIMASVINANHYVFGSYEEGSPERVHGNYWQSMNLPYKEKDREDCDNAHNRMLRDLHLFPGCNWKWGDGICETGPKPGDALPAPPLVRAPAVQAPPRAH